MPFNSSTVRNWMEHSDNLKRFIPVIRKTGIVHWLHALTLMRERRTNGEDRAAFEAFYEAHRDDFDTLRAMLADDFSRRTLDAVIKFRKTWRMRDIKDVVVRPQYFQRDIFGPVKDEVFIDGGAYTGDTLLSLFDTFGGGWNYCKKIYAWEPDSDNLRQIEKSLAGYADIEILPLGMWDRKDELHFDMNGGSDAKISEGGTMTIAVDSIDNLCSSDKITFIKMDIEGSEQAALRGAEKIIRRDKPRLAICIYHTPNDLFEIPFWIKRTVPDYKLYIRQHSDNVSETVLYATL